MRALEHDDLRPYFIRDGDRLIADMSFRQSATFRQKRTWLNNALYDAINRSRLLQLLNAVREARAARSAPDAPRGNDPERDIDGAAFLAPSNVLWQEAWELTEMMLNAMNADVRARGSRFLVVSGTQGTQVHSDPAVRRAYLQTLRADDFLYPGRRLRTVGERIGFDVLDLAPPFQRYAEEHRTPLLGFGSRLNTGHWNQAGHRLASDLISSRICAMAQGDR